MAAFILLCCDHETNEAMCGMHARSSAETVAQARVDAAAAGWRSRGGRDLCPGHHPDRQPERLQPRLQVSPDG